MSREKNTSINDLVFGDKSTKWPKNRISPTTTLAHIILCGSSAWALKYTPIKTPLAFGTFSYLLGYSVVATLNYVQPDDSPILSKACDIMAILTEIAPLPMVASQLYLINQMDPKYAYLPALSAFIPLVPQLLEDDKKEPAADIVCELIIAINIIALMYNNYDYDGPWTWGLIALTTINQFVFRRVADKYEVPKIDIVVFGLSFFCVFAVNCLCDAASA